MPQHDDLPFLLQATADGLRFIRQPSVRAAHRDTQALHAKLDELLRVDPKARTALHQLDAEEPEDIK